MRVSRYPQCTVALALAITLTLSLLAEPLAAEVQRAGKVTRRADQISG
jgi:hypothetical protein